MAQEGGWQVQQSQGWNFLALIERQEGWSVGVDLRDVWWLVGLCPLTLLGPGGKATSLGDPSHSFSLGPQKFWAANSDDSMAR